MRWLRTILEEVFGLFVDDGSFAIAIIVWLGITWFLSVHILADIRWSGVVLFGGLVAILIESVTRRARQ
ncbi:hypothetical protein KHC23_22690 [Ancylobacter dichloromethanicus]|jgi:hypothetical protein|uniref:Uncharacterized protein n=1 Tax=Ancylobacter dichloromethanicus TaxID=518825 RepID=A0A9W6JDI5_9HYPH|nr:hypothetical protein [Ancylobacter dichloromethanicus]MBS7556443.1 hypothetical protein [Ancylobacter dichloromethanicus]GLK73744.1 hypothetical protein GCM10017643_38620 [Ancylobacter dichloromethanicus]